MEAAYAIPVVLALVVVLFAIRHVVNRQRRLLDQYRKHRARQTGTGWPRTQPPDTTSPRSDMRASEYSASVEDAATMRRHDRMNPAAAAAGATRTREADPAVRSDPR